MTVSDPYVMRFIQHLRIGLYKMKKILTYKSESTLGPFRQPRQDQFIPSVARNGPGRLLGQFISGLLGGKVVFILKTVRTKHKLDENFQLRATSSDVTAHRVAWVIHII